MFGTRTGIAWLDDAALAVELATNAKEADRAASDLKTAQEYFSPLEEELRALLQGAKVMRPLGWHGAVVVPGLVDDISEAKRTLDSRPLRRVEKTLDSLKKEVRDSLINAWMSHASAELGNVNELNVLASALAKVEGLADLCRELEVKLGELARLQRDLPSPLSVERLSQAESLLRELEAALQPESVRKFLSAVAAGGASTDLLTKDVVTWLKSHNALESFKVVAGAPLGSK